MGSFALGGAHRELIAGLLIWTVHYLIGWMGRRDAKYPRCAAPITVINA